MNTACASVKMNYQCLNGLAKVILSFCCMRQDSIAVAGKQLPDQHVYAADLRFHGDSHSSGEINWHVLSEDIRLLVEQLDLENLVGVGHSIGGHLVARAAAALPHRFKQLLLIDPVIMSPEYYQKMAESPHEANPADHPVSRRKNKWRDADEMYQRFCNKPPFISWQPQVLRDYCDYALRPRSNEEFLELACDPINEASIYVNQTGNEAVHADLDKIITPTTILRAAPAKDNVRDLSTSPTWPGLAAALPCARERYLPDMSHFIPMQDPDMVAQYIMQAQANTWQTV